MGNALRSSVGLKFENLHHHPESNTNPPPGDGLKNMYDILIVRGDTLISEKVCSLHLLN
jgi:hypothetical protein